MKYFRSTLLSLPAIILLLLQAPAGTAQVKHPTSDGEKSCIKAQQRAQADWEAGRPKYYAFGIVALAEPISRALSEQHNINVINLGCVVGQEEVCYNETINKLMQQKTGKTIPQLIALAKTSKPSNTE